MAKYKMVNGVNVQLTAEEETELETMQTQMVVDEQANAYKRNRANEYPPIGDQLDYIYHNGLTKWKADMITPVKEKYPKPD